MLWSVLVPSQSMNNSSKSRQGDGQKTAEMMKMTEVNKKNDWREFVRGLSRPFWSSSCVQVASYAFWFMQLKAQAAQGTSGV